MNAQELFGLVTLVHKIEAVDEVLNEVDTDEDHAALNKLKELRADWVDELGFDPEDEAVRAAELEAELETLAKVGERA